MKQYRALMAFAGLLSLLPATAQKGFTIGARGGLNMTTLVGNDRTWVEVEEGFDRVNGYKFGAHAGVGMSLGLGRHGNSSVVVDVLFNMKGTRYEYNDKDAFLNAQDTIGSEISVKETITRLCVDLPILYRYRANSGIFAEGGMFVSFAVSTAYSTNDPRYDPIPPYDFKSIEEGLYKPLDVGVTAGLGWFSKGGFGVGARWFMGVLDQYEAYKNPLFVLVATPAGRTMNFGFQLSGIYYIGWGKKSRW